MQIKLFNIPIGADDYQVEELNHFLRAHTIIDIKKELAVLDGNSCWTFCVTYMQTGSTIEADQGKRKVDYKEVLVPEVFARFSELRKIRKSLAANDAVPAYAVFTDAELAEMAKLPEITTKAMLGIPGIGEKRVDKYGEAFCNFQAVDDETSGTPD